MTPPDLPDRPAVSFWRTIAVLIFAGIYGIGCGEAALHNWMGVVIGICGVAGMAYHLLILSVRAAHCDLSAQDGDKQ